MNVIEFEVYGHCEPQGSKRGFVVPGKNGGKPRAVVVDNKSSSLKTFRQEVTRTAMAAVTLRPWAGKHVPIRLRLDFFLPKPPSCPKSRCFPVVKPDVDKLVRSCGDALTSVLYADDSQVVQLIATKNYGSVEMVRIRAEILTS